MKIWQGIVEDNSTDEQKIGRIKVRIFGKHTEYKEYDENNNKYSVDELPYAHPIFPITSTSISNEGVFSIPEQGSIVIGMYIDPYEQVPMYFGTIPKLLTEMPDYEFGFTDPSGKYPKEEFLGDIGYNRLAAGEKTAETIVQTKRDNAESGIDCGNGKVFSETPTPYNAEYPKNKVIQTPSGHVIELDDSSGSERIHIYHKSGTFNEIHPDGTNVNKSSGRNIEVDLLDKDVLVKGSNNVRVEGSRNVKIVQDDKKEVDGNMKIDVVGNTDLTVTGNINIVGQSAININSSNDTTINSSSNIIMNSTGYTQLTASAVSIESYGSATVTGTGINVEATSNVSVTAPTVEIN